MDYLTVGEVLPARRVPSMFSSITKLKLGYQDPGRNLNRTALDITVRSRDPSLFYPPATSPEAAHAAVAIQKFHSPSPEQGPNKWVNFCCGRVPSSP